jgi:hypothetical protein
MAREGASAIFIFMAEFGVFQGPPFFGSHWAKGKGRPVRAGWQIVDTVA